MLTYLDWVGLDVKCPDALFDTIVVRPELEDLRCLALDLAAQGVERYAIQVARTGQCLEEAYTQPVMTSPTTTELHALVHRLQPAFRRMELRE